MGYSLVFSISPDNRASMNKSMEIKRHLGLCRRFRESGIRRMRCTVGGMRSLMLLQKDPFSLRSAGPSQHAQFSQACLRPNPKLGPRYSHMMVIGS